MNFSVYSADRATHLRIVVSAFAASIVIAAFALSVRIHSDRLLAAQPPFGGQVTAPKALTSSEFRGDSPIRIAIR
jgi:hypothetical protein